jgi:hypothetical protein
VPRNRAEHARRLTGWLLLAVSLGGCGALTVSPPPPAPESFPGIAGRLGQYGIDVSSWTSGDSGCEDPTLNPTAIRFTANGLDQSTPLTLRIYIFADRAAWDRRLADVDTCSGAWATDPSSFEIVQTSPYVVAGQGPWPPQFADALRKAIGVSAGTGG